MAQGKAFDRKALTAAFHELGCRAHAEGKTIEIAIYGGPALMLTYDGAESGGIPAPNAVHQQGCAVSAEHAGAGGMNSIHRHH